MNFALLAPLGLFALGALLLPLLLHLARRTPQRRTEFAALRWLATRLRPRRRIRVEEPWLLLLRLLLVACVALLLAQPVWTRLQGGPPRVLVHPALAADAARQAIDCPDDCEWHWLAPRFPPLDDARPAATPPVASLLREADATLPTGTRLHVVVPSELEGVDAERPRLAREVEWKVLPGPVASAVRATKPAAFTLAVRGAPDAPGRPYLRAAARANGWTLDESADAAPPARAGAVLWLDATPVPPAMLDWARQGGTLWIATGASAAPSDAREAWRDARDAWRDARGTPVARELTLGRGRLLQWQQALRPEALPLLLEPAFARELAGTLQPPDADRQRAPAEALRPRAGGARYTPPPRPLDPWLATLALVLFAAERLLATRRGRSLGA